MVSLNELYRYATGLTQIDIESKIEEMKNNNAGKDEQAKYISAILKNVPGGYFSSNYDELRKKISEEFSYIGDVTGDNKVTKKDVKTILSYIGTENEDEIEKYDISYNKSVGQEDVTLAEILSTAEVETEE